MVVWAGASLRVFPVSTITKNSISGLEIKIFLQTAARAAVLDIAAGCAIIL